MRRHSKARFGGRLLVAALLVAAGDLAGVWTAARSEVTGWWSGPAVMALSIVLAGLWLWPVGGSRIVKVSVVYGAILIVVCAFGADDPQSLREILAVSGVGLGGVFVVSAPEVIERRRRAC